MTKPNDINKGLAHADLMKALRYDPQTGKLFWRAPNNQCRKNPEAGWRNPQTGYLIIKVFGRGFLAHRLIWFYVHGRWPEDRLDHKDGDQTNNRIDNLREASDHQSACNKGVYANSASGIKGVRLHETGRWQARIFINGRNKHLGLFDTSAQAAAVYRKHAKEHFGDFARLA